MICAYRRLRPNRDFSPRSQASGRTDPVGASASTTTRNTMATSTEQASARMMNQNGAIEDPLVGATPCIAREIGPATPNARPPAASRRISPNRTPSSRRAMSAIAHTSPATVTMMIAYVATSTRSPVVAGPHRR